MKGRICGMRSLTTAVEALEARKMFAGYRITDLGHIQPSSIDEAGYVVGSTNEGIGVGGQPIVVSPDGGITKLTQPNGTTGSAVGRNAAGDVLVNTTSTLYSDLTLIYKNGQKTTVAQTDGVALNNSGTVLLSDYLFGRSYIWDGSLHNIGGLPSPNGIQKYDETGAYDINDAGDIVGYCSGGQGGLAIVATLRSASGQWTSLGTLGNGYSKAYGINNKNQIVGVTSFHAFLYQNGAMSDLGVLPGDVASEAREINEAGEIIGFSSSEVFGGNKRPFLYSNGAMRELNTLVDASSKLDFNWVYAINNAGQILTTAYVGGQEHAFVLTPTRPLASLSSGGTLTASGSSKKDSFSISMDKKGRVLIISNLGSIAFKKSQVKRLSIDLGGGNDKISVGSGLPRININGGGGNDTIVGGGGNDFLYGGPGADRIYGGAGNDTLSGGSGNDRLYGDGGSDAFDGGSGNDILASRDGARDTLVGGTGINYAQIDKKQLDKCTNIATLLA
jgi:probable HAF family extracellular repeat protein